MEIDVNVPAAIRTIAADCNADVPTIRSGARAIRSHLGKRTEAAIELPESRQRARGSRGGHSRISNRPWRRCYGDSAKKSFVGRNVTRHDRPYGGVDGGLCVR